jgi:hypothetical protein
MEMSDTVFTVNVVSLTGDILHTRNYSHPVMVNTVISDARSFVDINSRWSETVAYAEIWWTGTLVDTLTPEWLTIPDVNDEELYHEANFADANFD